MWLGHQPRQAMNGKAIAAKAAPTKAFAFHGLPRDHHANTYPG
jgi:hypothetical protein